MHVEDAADGGAVKAHGGEAVLDGIEGGERSGTEIWVLREGFVGINFETCEVLELLMEEETRVCSDSGKAFEGFREFWRREERGRKKELSSAGNHPLSQTTPNHLKYR